MGRPSLRSRFSSRASLASTRSATPAPTEQPLRLPLELILQIVAQATASCVDRAERNRLRASLRAVNRLFAAAFPRQTFLSIAVDSGEELPSLLKLTQDEPALADVLEGVSVRNIVPYESRQGLQRLLPKLRKACPQLVYLRLGSSTVQIKSGTGIPAYLLAEAEGLSALHLHQIELTTQKPSRSLLRWTPKPPAAHLPPSLRHLVLDHVRLDTATCSDPLSLPPLLPAPTPNAQSVLTTLYLANLHTTLEPARDPSASLVASLLNTAAPTLRALHFSASRPHRTGRSHAASFFDSLAPATFPVLRVLSLSLAHFSPAVFAATPQVEHLALTLCDLQRGLGLVIERRFANGIALGAFERALRGQMGAESASDGSGVEAAKALELPPRLKSLEMGVQADMSPREQEQPSYVRQEEQRDAVFALLAARGIDARRVEHVSDDVKERWRERVREVSGEKV
ncbi:hypothetical protein JCM10207_001316 [Rhodosporidiobolus poonsookiae]